MDLVIKLSTICNWRCSYCSSTLLSEHSTDYLDVKYVIDFLKRFPDTKTLIVNGGEPLLKMHKKFYEDILNFLDSNNYKTSVSITSNLWEFYRKPDEWLWLLKHPRVGVTTSFEYFPEGSKKGRLKPDFTSYTEEDFWKVSDLFLDLLKYRPDFISVITNDNKHLAIKNVELAKKMSNDVPPTSFSNVKTGVECKLNYVMGSGEVKTYNVKGEFVKQGARHNSFVIADIYKVYVDIWKQGLYHWDFSTKQMMKVIQYNGCTTSCPLNKKCDLGIRTMNPTNSKKTGNVNLEKKYFSCPAMSDDREELSAIDFNQEIYGNKFFTPIQDDKKYTTLKKSCINCPMFNICNGCKKTISDYHRKGGLVIEDHCKKMKELSPNILRANGFKEDEIKSMLTSYKQEYND